MPSKGNGEGDNIDVLSALLAHVPDTVVGMNAPMRAHLAAGTYRAVMRQNALRADFSARPNENKGANFAA